MRNRGRGEQAPTSGFPLGDPYVGVPVAITTISGDLDEHSQPIAPYHLIRIQYMTCSVERLATPEEVYLWQRQAR